MYKLEIKDVAEKSLSKIPQPYRERIKKKIYSLADNPFPPDSKKLKESDNLRRVRVGQYRVIYEVKKDEILVLIVKIGHRKDVYR